MYDTNLEKTITFLSLLSNLSSGCQNYVAAIMSRITEDLVTSKYLRIWYRIHLRIMKELFIHCELQTRQGMVMSN